MLFLVGMGLSEGDLTRRAIEVCSEAETQLYSENYTSNLTPKRISALSMLFGKEIKQLNRQDMEDKVSDLVDLAKSSDIAILIGGDPLIATTHKIVYIEAKKNGIDVEAVHSTSILTTAIGESGLDFYRFGQICTIPRWSEHYKPVSFYETILKNQNANLHSLLLLDFDQDTGSSIQPSYAANILMEAEKAHKKGIINDHTMLIVLHNLSMPNQRTILMDVKIASRTDVDNGPTVLILPAKLSDTENEIVSAIFGV